MKLDYDHFCGALLFIAGCCESLQPMGGVAIPEKVGLGSIRKIAKQTVNSVPLGLCFVFIARMPSLY